MSNRERLPLEYVLLGFLAQGPTHGYDLHQRVEDELGLVWYMGISNVYGALKRLEEEGQVESTLAPQESRPPRRIYGITPRGRAAFLNWVRSAVPSMRNMRVEFPAKLYFLRALDLDGAQELIATQETICRERVARLDTQEAKRAGRHFDHLVLDFRRRQLEAILDWLELCRENLAPGEVTP
jgi:PadR family transcriptional regulator AphA